MYYNYDFCCCYSMNKCSSGEVKEKKNTYITYNVCIPMFSVILWFVFLTGKSDFERKTFIATLKVTMKVFDNCMCAVCVR